MGFQLLFSSIVTVIEGVNISLNIISNCSRCIRGFKLLIYLGTRAYIVILLKALYARNLLLLKRPSCLGAAAVYRVFIEFLFRLSRCFKGE